MPGLCGGECYTEIGLKYQDVMQFSLSDFS